MARETVPQLYGFAVNKIEELPDGRVRLVHHCDGQAIEIMDDMAKISIHEVYPVSRCGWYVYTPNRPPEAVDFIIQDR